MTKFNYLLPFICLVFSQLASAQVKIGDNPTVIGAGSILELESTNKALVVPRVASTTFIGVPVEGMIVYDSLFDCFKGFQNGSWSACGFRPNVSAMSIITYEIAAGKPSTVTAQQLVDSGISEVEPLYERAYQAAIDQDPGSFSNPAELWQIQDLVMFVNLNTGFILEQVGNEADIVNGQPSSITVEQLQFLGVLGVDPSKIIAYRAFINSNRNLFTNPSTFEQIQDAVNFVNASGL